VNKEGDGMSLRRCICEVSRHRGRWYRCSI